MELNNALYVKSKSVSEFYFDSKQNLVKSDCKVCNRLSRHLPERKQKDKTTRIATRIKRVYGVTIEKYNELFTLQEGKCAICGKEEIDKKGNLSIDHNHETGEVRGLLCRSCNLGIGNLNDSINLLKLAIQYLEKYER